jgi:hypothetical protein
MRYNQPLPGPSLALVTQRIVCCPAKADIQVRFPASAKDGSGFLWHPIGLPSILQMMSIEFAFEEKKAAQTAARILELAGGSFDYLSLVKMLYIIDREAMRSWGHPVSGGPYFSLPAGPVNNPLLRVVNGEVQSPYWAQHIQRKGNTLVLLADPGKGKLSEDELDLIAGVFDLWGSLSSSELVKMTHDFREWVDPKGSSLPIQGGEILSAVGKTPEEILEIEKEQSSVARMREILGQ